MNCLLIFFLLTGECFHSGPGLTILRSASIILRKFCPLCYKHLRECSLFMGRGGGRGADKWGNGTFGTFCTPPARTCKRF